MNYKEFFDILETFTYNDITNMSPKEIAHAFNIDTNYDRFQSFELQIDNNIVKIVIGQQAFFIFNLDNSISSNSCIDFYYYDDGTKKKCYVENNIDCVEIIDKNYKKSKIMAEFNFKVDFGYVKDCTFSLKNLNFLSMNVGSFYKDIFSENLIFDEFIKKFIKDSFVYSQTNIYSNRKDIESNLDYREKMNQYIKQYIDNNLGKHPEQFTDEERFYYMLKNS